jgi:glycosyltransferase involved in cell wall biosynthesis
MACSLAPVVTEIPGNAEWIKDEVNGLLVPVADSEKLADKILLLATDKEYRARLQANANITTKKRVNWARNIEKFSEIVEETLAIYKSSKYAIS